MALPTTTASSISLSQIQTEFGGSNPIALSEYKRGGSYVPSGTAAGTYGTAIPTTNSNLSMKNYYGTQNKFTTTITTSSRGIVGPPYYGYIADGYFVNGLTGATGSITDNTVDTMTNTPIIRRITSYSGTNNLFQVFLNGNQTSASPQLTSVDWVNSTRSTSGSFSSFTVQYINNWSSPAVPFTSYSSYPGVSFSINASDVVTFTFNLT